MKKKIYIYIFISFFLNYEIHLTEYFKHIRNMEYTRVHLKPSQHTVKRTPTVICTYHKWVIRTLTIQEIRLKNSIW